MPSALESLVGLSLPAACNANAADVKPTSRPRPLVLALIGIAYGLFWAFYLVIAARFDSETRRIDLPALLNLGLPAWWLVSAWAYVYVSNPKFLRYFTLPGLAVGGSFFLALISFSFEQQSEGTVYAAQSVTYLCLLGVYLLHATGLLRRRPMVEQYIIQACTCLFAVLLTFSSKFALKVLVSRLPFLSFLIVPFELKVMIITLGAAFIFSSLALLQLRLIEENHGGGDPLQEDLSIAASALFLIFFLYLSFLFFFGAKSAREKKR